MLKKKSLYILILTTISNTLDARSPHRPKDPTLPSITTCLDNGPQRYTLVSSHWEPYAFTLFDEDYFRHHMLPTTPLSFRNNNNERVSTELLNRHIEKLLEEIAQKQKRYTHFTVLQKKDFNRRKRCGLLILKFKHFPFVFKLFLETPQSFVNPWCKGREPIFFFYMGGGINRHVAGLTRIKNLNIINEKIQSLPDWKDLISTPRKWYWLPKNPSWINIYGKNIGGQKEMQTKVPAIFGIVADYIENNGSLSLANPAHRKTALKLCNDLGMLIDPHIQNFFIEKNTNKLVIVDTEHFPSVVGFKEEKRFNNYLEWYLRLMGICSKNLYFRDKQERKNAQFIHSPYELT